MATISNTAGGSGAYTLGQVTGPALLFTTPATPDAIFIIYVTQGSTSGPVTNGNPKKIMVGPSTDVTWPDGNSAAGVITWNWVQMVIS